MLGNWRISRKIGVRATSRKEQVRGAHLWCKKQAYSDASNQLSQSAIKRINFHAMESSIRSGLSRLYIVLNRTCYFLITECTNCISQKDKTSNSHFLDISAAKHARQFKQLVVSWEITKFKRNRYQRQHQDQRLLSLFQSDPVLRTVRFVPVFILLKY